MCCIIEIKPYKWFTYSLSQGNNLSLMPQLLLSFIKAYYLILNSSLHKSIPTPHV